MKKHNTIIFFLPGEQWITNENWFSKKWQFVTSILSFFKIIKAVLKMANGPIDFLIKNKSNPWVLSKSLELFLRDAVIVTFFSSEEQVTRL